MSTETLTKTCTTCKVSKLLTEYHNSLNCKYGVKPVCKNCKKIRAKKYYEVNIDSKKVKDKLYREKNKESINLLRKERYYSNRELFLKRGEEYRVNKKELLSLKTRTYYRNNKEICIARANLYAELNKEKLRPSKNACTAKRRAFKIDATPSWSEIEEIKELYKLCNKISKETGILHHVDHIVPLRGKNVSGLHVIANLRIIPASENLAKGNKLIENVCV